MTHSNRPEIDPKHEPQEGGPRFTLSPLEVISGALMLVGIILTFFYFFIGGMLVGLAVGLCFFHEIQSYFSNFMEIYHEHGIFKTLMLLATILFFLITIPAFIVAAAVGFAAILIIRLSYKK